METPRRTRIDSLRCQLFINGTVYTVRPIAVEDGSKCYAFRKWDNTEYAVRQDAEGFLSCDCGDHTFRRDQVQIQGCKHCRALVALGMFSRPPLLEMRSAR